MRQPFSWSLRVQCSAAPFFPSPRVKRNEVLFPGSVLHRGALLFFVFFLIILSACSPLPTASPPLTPQTLLLTRPAALAGWDARFYACAQNFSQLAIFVEEKAPASLEQNDPTIAFHFGAPTDLTGKSYIIAYEDILLAASQNFPREDISLTQLQGIFNGQLATAQALDPASAPDPLQAWTYPLGDETRQLFDNAVFADGTAPVLALIAPDPSAMLEALATTPDSIGYLPASALSLASADQTSQIKTLSLNDGSAEFSHQPVIAQLSAEPGILQNAFMQCLQGPNK